MRFIVADDDQDILTILEVSLKKRGHQVSCYSNGDEALAAIRDNPPDAAVLDIMMPGIDGLELVRQLRAEPKLKNVKVIVHSGKNFDFDKRRALSFGADAFYVKGELEPSDLCERLERLARGQLSYTFWGARGTLPVPGQKSLKYGGNTACVSLTFPNGLLFVFDAGTGIKQLGDHLLRQGFKSIRGKIFITHPHWDHINALPFFVPLFIPGNKFEILAARHGDIGVEQMVNDQMDCIYFPITAEEFGAHVRYTELNEGEYEIEGVQVTTMKLCHPGTCLGYRIDHAGVRFCYVTDNELFLPDTAMHSEAYNNQLVEFIRHADVLITDACYTDAEYPRKVGWGHSCVSQVAKLAARAEVKTLYLYHHDPGQSDEDIEAKVTHARQVLEGLGSQVECVAPVEGQEILLAGPS